MAKQHVRTEQEIRERTEPRYSELPYVCMHCKNLVSVGNQFFDPRGWTCPAYPVEVLQGILTGDTPHTAPFASQVGTDVYDPIIYTEEDTGREWNYTADGRWKYFDGGPL